MFTTIDILNGTHCRFGKRGWFIESSKNLVTVPKKKKPLLYRWCIVVVKHKNKNHKKQCLHESMQNNLN